MRPILTAVALSQLFGAIAGFRHGGVGVVIVQAMIVAVCLLLLAAGALRERLIRLYGPKSPLRPVALQIVGFFSLSALGAFTLQLPAYALASWLHRV